LLEKENDKLKTANNKKQEQTSYCQQLKEEALEDHYELSARSTGPMESSNKTQKQKKRKETTNK
jgi:hypothetical protein